MKKESSGFHSDGRDAADPGRTDHREAAACNALRTLIRDFVLREMGGPPQGGEPLDLPLRLRVEPAPEGPWQVSFQPSLEQQFREACTEIAAEWGAYQPGSVYCYRCNSSICAHAAPPSPLMVFKAYGTTGVPQWQELTQAFLDARDERVEQLFGEAPGFVARYALGSNLKAEQLSSFGKSSKTYALLGQVVAGYAFLDAGRGVPGTGERVALTVQLVEARDARGAFALRLNPVCTIPGGATLTELFASDWGSWMQRALAKAGEEVQRMERLASAARRRKDTQGVKVAMGDVPRILRQLSTSLERGRRQARRRTRHVQLRREQQRPVHMAMADLYEAGADDFLFDEKTDSCVVRGAHARFHVFARDGRHVTSFVGHNGSTDYRLRTRRWRPLEEKERREFALPRDGAVSTTAGTSRRRP